MKLKTILIIDDNEDDRILLSTVLTANGYRVSCLSSGINVLDALAKQSADAIALDLFMPIMDGTETLQVIKASYPNIPVIAMSGLGSTYLPMMKYLGATAIATKSQCFQDVVEKLDKSIAIANSTLH